MSSTLKQSQKQKQTQTPQQIMLNRLLVPLDQLDVAVQNELNNNVMLEREEDADDYAPTNEASDAAEWPSTEGEEPADYDETTTDNVDDLHQRQELSPIDETELDSFDDDHVGRTQHAANYDGETSPFDNYANHRSLYEELTEQLGMVDFDDDERAIAQELIGSLDERGFLSRDTAIITNDLAFKRHIDTTEQQVIRILKVIQTFDPAGVAARSEQECLLLQLQRRPADEVGVQTAMAVVGRCYHELVQKKYAVIQRRLHIDGAQLQQALSVIRHLTISPGFTFVQTAVDNIVPDFIVTVRNGKPVVMLNNDERHIPRIGINKTYDRMLSELQAKPRRNPREEESYQFMKTHKEEAELFMSALKERGTALRATMEAIVRHQKDYFLSGDKADLHPLLQKDIAAETGFDNSTISRIVNAKYVQTDFGLIKLDQFFSFAITNAEGEETAQVAVKDLLQRLIETEDKQHPLTDEKLAEKITEAGYPISRRVVSKYRESQGIPTSRLRKDLK